MNTEILSKRIKEKRLERGMTQQEVADILNITQPSYAVYETGKNVPSLENLIKIAEMFNTSIDYLTGRDIKTMMKAGFKMGFDKGEEKGDQIKQRVSKKRKSRRLDK